MARPPSPPASPKNAPPIVCPVCSKVVEHGDVEAHRDRHFTKKGALRKRVRRGR